MPEGAPPPFVSVPRAGRQDAYRLDVARRPRTWISTYDEVVRASGEPGLTWRDVARANGLPGVDAHRELPAWVVIRMPRRLPGEMREESIVLRSAYPTLLRLALFLRDLNKRLQLARRRFLRPGLAARLALARICHGSEHLRNAFIGSQEINLILLERDQGWINRDSSYRRMHRVFLELHDHFRKAVARSTLDACFKVREVLGDSASRFEPLLQEYNAFIASSPQVFAFAEPAPSPPGFAALAPLLALTERNEAWRLLAEAQRAIAEGLSLVSRIECIGRHLKIMTREEQGDWLPWLQSAEAILQCGSGPGPEPGFVAPRAEPLRGWMLLKTLLKAATKVAKELPEFKDHFSAGHKRDPRQRVSLVAGVSPTAERQVDTPPSNTETFSSGRSTTDAGESIPASSGSLIRRRGRRSNPPCCVWSPRNFELNSPSKLRRSLSCRCTR